jgi:MFS family permease
MFFGYALFFVNGVTFLMGSTNPEQRNLAFSAQTAIFSLSGFVGGLLGGLLPGLVRPDLPAA